MGKKTIAVLLLGLALGSVRFAEAQQPAKVPKIGWLQARSPSGPGGGPESFLREFRTEPNDLIQPIHNRMPVILRPEDEEQWLDASRTPFVKAKSLLKPYPEELMDAHDVSAIVNSAKYDGPECIQPVSDDDIPRGEQLSLL